MSRPHRLFDPANLLVERWSIVGQRDQQRCKPLTRSTTSYHGTVISNIIVGLGQQWARIWEGARNALTISALRRDAVCFESTFTLIHSLILIERPTPATLYLYHSVWSYVKPYIYMIFKSLTRSLSSTHRRTSLLKPSCQCNTASNSTPSPRHRAPLLLPLSEIKKHHCGDV